MALRYERRAGPPPGTPATGFTVADVGRALCRERTRQGLSLKDVSMTTGIPVDQLRAAETGALDRPDGLSTLKTVRRYADLLGLPGDRYALAILERWPTAVAPRPFAVTRHPGATGRHDLEPGAATGATGPTSALPALGALTAPNGTKRARAEARTNPGPQAGSGHGAAAAVVDTGAHTAVVRPIPWAGTEDDPGYDVVAYSDTGVTPAVRASRDHVWHPPRRRVPPVLKALVVVVTLAVLAGIAVLAIDRYRPRWLHTLGITTTASAAGAHGTAPHHATATPTAALRPLHATAGTATFDAGAPRYTLELAAIGTPCWAEVTTPTSAAPLYAGIVQPGSPRTLRESRRVVVDLGSTSGRISIASRAGRLTTYAPPTVPFKVTVGTGGH